MALRLHIKYSGTSIKQTPFGKSFLAVMHEKYVHGLSAWKGFKCHPHVYTNFMSQFLLYIQMNFC